MTKKSQNIFWFLFVMLILGFGITMIIWTVKQASSVPVHESNNYMLKYQMADMNINQIMALEEKFNAKYRIEIQDTQFIELKESQQNSNAKRAQGKPIKLHAGANSFSYGITEGKKSVDNAKVTFLLTRPHTRDDDYLEENLTFKDNLYRTKTLDLTKKGRYTLQLKVEIDGLVGYSEIPAYLTK